MKEKANHQPKNKGTKALFKNPVLERLTRTHISIPLILYSTISGGLIYYGTTDFGLELLPIILLFVGGAITFTLVEYMMHRFVFHMEPTSPRKEKISYTMHGVHHDYPKDKDRLAMPPLLSILLATGFFFLFRLIMGDYVFGFLPGFLMGYASYLWVHYMVHAFSPPKNFFKILWVHHGIHHYKEPERAFGVSSPLWDLIFSTMPKTKKYKVNKPL